MYIIEYQHEPKYFSKSLSIYIHLYIYIDTFVNYIYMCKPKIKINIYTYDITFFPGNVSNEVSFFHLSSNILGTEKGHRQRERELYI